MKCSPPASSPAAWIREISPRPRWWYALTVLSAIALGGPAQAAAPAAADLEFFEKKIRPLLVEHCYSCHSALAKKLRGGLHLDSAEGWLKGGDRGPAVKPGDPDRSLLIAAVKHEDELLEMPPRGKLTDQQIALLTRWVSMGAPAPRVEAAKATIPARPTDLTKAREFWSLKAPADPPMPPVADAAWPRSALDRFILAALEAKGLTPATPADKRTLIRRATFDLIGLPPTPEEIDAFLKDDAPDAFAKVVDRLLASPHYGERWGRHWLDVARYADSNGLDENVAHGNAWRYRDYVVAAFNRDKPYDQFVLEQVAGDLLPAATTAQKHERLTATGFLSLGPKVLAEVDEQKMEMDIVDEQVDVVGRTFMGLTLGCARCHDHKFDPISTADYYGLAGVFKSTRTMETFKKVARWHENSLATEDELKRKAARDKENAAKKEANKKQTEDLQKQLDAAQKQRDQATAEKQRTQLSERVRSLMADLTRLKDAGKELDALAKAEDLPSAMGVSEGKVVDTKIHVRGSHLTLGPLVPRRIPLVLADSTPPLFGEKQSGRLELARWLVEGDHPLTGRVMANRIWRWHFGRGLVASPDNFGTLGARPTNPPLLDWLAHRFVETGWSVKAMHRLIMLSSTYQMSSADSPTAERIDPENRMFWRVDVRRLEAEPIRDALLAVGGKLDRTIGGSLLRVKNRDYFFDHTSRDNTDYSSPRRSIYLPVVRNHLYDMFELFDYPDASVTNGDRATTTVAPQALLMMNSELVLQSSANLAAVLLSRPELDDAGRIALLHEIAYGRPPSPDESRRASAYLGRLGQTLGENHDQAQRVAAWQALCQVILASNEFIYVR